MVSRQVIIHEDISVDHKVLINLFCNKEKSDYPFKDRKNIITPLFKEKNCNQNIILIKKHSDVLRLDCNPIRAIEKVYFFSSTHKVKAHWASMWTKALKIQFHSILLEALETH